MGELIDPNTRAKQLRSLVEQRRTDFDKLMSAVATKQRDAYFQTLLTALRNPDLQQCQPITIIDSMLKSAQWALPVDGTHSAFVAYGDTCTFIPMYRGLVAVCRRSGDIRQVWGDVVFEEEPFRVIRGSEDRIEHTPDITIDRTDGSKVVAAYACAKWAHGDVQSDVMTRFELDKLRAVSRVKSPKGPWGMWTTEMMKVRPLKRLMKLLPLQEGLHSLLDEMERDELDLEGPVVNTRASSPRRRAQTLDDLGTAALPAPEAEPLPAAQPEAKEAVPVARGAKQAEKIDDWGPRRD